MSEQPYPEIKSLWATAGWAYVTVVAILVVVPFLAAVLHL